MSPPCGGRLKCKPYSILSSIGEIVWGMRFFDEKPICILSDKNTVHWPISLGETFKFVIAVVPHLCTLYNKHIKYTYDTCSRTVVKRMLMYRFISYYNLRLEYIYFLNDVLIQLDKYIKRIYVDIDTRLLFAQL